MNTVISVLHVQPGCGAYSPRIWIMRDAWFDLPAELKHAVSKLTLWGNYDKSAPIGEMGFASWLDKKKIVISLEVEENKLGALVQLLVTGKIPKDNEMIRIVCKNGLDVEATNEQS